MVERFNGRIQREVLGITVSSHRDLETLLRGFNQAYNARRQRVLKGRSPEMVVSERLGALPARANPSHDPPFDPCSLPKALQVIAHAKDVSHPDNYPTIYYEGVTIRNCPTLRGHTVSIDAPVKGRPPRPDAPSQKAEVSIRAPVRGRHRWG